MSLFTEVTEILAGMNPPVQETSWKR